MFPKDRRNRNKLCQFWLCRRRLQKRKTTNLDKRQPEQLQHECPFLFGNRPIPKHAVKRAEDAAVAAAARCVGRSGSRSTVIEINMDVGIVSDIVTAYRHVLPPLSSLSLSVSLLV